MEINSKWNDMDEESIFISKLNISLQISVWQQYLQWLFLNYFQPTATSGKTLTKIAHLIHKPWRRVATPKCIPEWMDEIMNMLGRPFYFAK